MTHIQSEDPGWKLQVLHGKMQQIFVSAGGRSTSMKDNMKLRQESHYQDYADNSIQDYYLLAVFYIYQITLNTAGNTFKNN